MSFLIENFEIYFDNKFPDLNFKEYFSYNVQNKKFMLKKSNKYFFQIVFDHPILKDFFY